MTYHLIGTECIIPGIIVFVVIIAIGVLSGLSSKPKKGREHFAWLVELMFKMQNEGLLIRTLESFPYITSLSYESGGWRDASVRIQMQDGFSILVYKSQLNAAICEAALQVFNRLVITEQITDE